MRQFDNLQSYLDNAGNPLAGRAKFCDVNGTLQQIKDHDGNVIDSIVFTDSSGRLSKQVFLEDVDYRIVFEKYAGNTEMSDDDEDGVWEFQFESYNLYDTFDIKVETVGTQCVSTIKDLRLVNPATIGSDSSKRIVKVLGYDAAGDKPSVEYYFDSTDTSSVDNGGSVIKPSGTNTGRWKIVIPFDEIDVRHFGAFPFLNPDVDDDGCQETCILNANNYSSSSGLRLFFPSIGNRVYYGCKNVVLKNISCSKNTRIFNSDFDNTASSPLTIVGDGDVYAYADGEGHGGKVVVSSDIVRTSFNSNNSTYVSLKPISKVVFDTEYVGGSKWSDVDVVLEVDQSNKITFERCNISGQGKFLDGAEITFKECKIVESFLDESLDIEDCEFDDCFSNIYEWSDKDRFMKYCVINGMRDIDVMQYTITELPTVTENMNLRNAVLNMPANTVIQDKWNFYGCTFNNSFQSVLWSCEDCYFDAKPHILLKNGTFTGKFIGVKFRNKTNVVIEVENLSQVILKYISIENCVFDNVDPLIANNGMTSTDYIIQGMSIVDNAGSNWNSDEFDYAVYVHVVDSNNTGLYDTYCEYKAGLTEGFYKFRLKKFTIGNVFPVMFNKCNIKASLYGYFDPTGTTGCKNFIKWGNIDEVVYKDSEMGTEWSGDYQATLTEASDTIIIVVHAKILKQVQD